MEFRRINSLPPYVFAAIDALKMAARRAGEDVIDLGFGNPDIPSPEIAVEKLGEAARNPRNHRYSASRGIPKLRQAIADLYRASSASSSTPRPRSSHHRRQGGPVAPDVGAARPGRHRLVPSPSYPIHIYAPLFAGAEVRQVRLGPGEDFFENLHEAWEQSVAAARG